MQQRLLRPHSTRSRTALAALLSPLAALALAAPLGAQSSPIPAPTANDELFVVNQDDDLDTPCTFSGGGPFLIEFKVTRYVGETDSQGFLLSPDDLIAKGIVSAKARLRMPAFDVDSGASIPGYVAEIDVVSLNGHEVGTLSGLDNTWIMNEFEVPISFVKFPKRGVNGQPLEPAVNVVKIDIDTGNDVEAWCTSIDWVSLSAKAMHPVFLVHGFNSNPGTWAPAFTSHLQGAKVPFEHQIIVSGTGSITDNATVLATTLSGLAKEFGVHSAHLVGHSKGGLDIRRYLSTHYDEDELSILSLSTLNTPHHGSILADLIVAFHDNEDAQSEDPELQQFLTGYWWLQSFLPISDAVRDLQVSVADEFNAANALPGGVQMRTFGSDADANDDGTIQDTEVAGLVEQNVPASAANLCYGIVATTASISVQNKTGAPFGLNEWSVVTPVTTAAKPNDIIVTDESARHPAAVSHSGPLNANHGTIKSAATAAAVLANIKSAFPVSSN